MPIVATFRSVDDTGDDFQIGTVTWDDAARTATADPPAGFLADVAKSVQEWSDPADAMRQLPTMYKSAYLRAEIKETEGEKHGNGSGTQAAAV